MINALAIFVLLMLIGYILTKSCAFIYSIMKKPSYLIRLLILGLLLCSPIGFTQLGWYLYGKETGINIGMVTGTIAVVIVAYLMYQMGWREED